MINFLKRISLKLILAIYLFIACIGPVRALESLSPDVSSKMGSNAERIGRKVFDPATDGDSLNLIIASVLRIFFSLLGIICVVLIIKAGFDWMTAQGNSAKVTSAQGTIKTAAIGLVIIAAAYAITYWIFARLPTGN